MITSSFKGIVKPGEAKVEAFSFPVQLSSPAKKSVKEKGPKAEDVPLPCPESREEADYMALGGAGGIIEGAKADARQIIIEANAQAEDIIAKARQTADRIKKESASQGREEGYREGYEQGRKESMEKSGRLLREQQDVFRSSLETALSAIDAAKERSIEKYLDELKDCSLAVAEKVICVSLKSSGHIIKRMLVSEIEKLKRTAWVKIYMEKSDYNMMMEADADVVNELARLSDNIKFIVMNKESNGSCIIEMPEEIVDISVDTQMDNIRELLENIKV